MILRWFGLSLLVCGLFAAAGCGGPPGMEQVSGKVTYEDGSFPAGEIATIRFEPIAGTQAPDQSKGASGDIKPDGTYSLSTIEKGDGAYVGEYKVCFTILKSYIGRESLVDPQFAAAMSTPLTAKVTSAGPNKFDFTIKKAAGR